MSAPTLETHANFINGKWVAPGPGEYYARIKILLEDAKIPARERSPSGRPLKTSSPT
jgi:hypothetical protein